MAVFRDNRNYFFGTLSAGCASTDVTLSSASFANLPNAYYGATSIILPLILQNAATGAFEIVYVTAHTASSTSITVVRGQEGSTAQAWPAGTPVGNDITTYDGKPVGPKAGFPAAPQIGLEGVFSDALFGGIPAIATANAGWQPSVGMGWNTDQGNDIATAAAVPAGSTILCRAGQRISGSPAAHILAITFVNPFPNGIITCIAGSGNQGQFQGVVACSSMTRTGFTAFCSQLDTSSPGTATVNYLAVGW